MAVSSIITVHMRNVDPAKIRAQEGLRREFHEVIDKAQLWYSRPSVYGGGNKSFRNLDFQRLGYSEVPNRVTWKGKYADYMLTSTRSSSFDIIATSPNGERYESILIGFDTMPVIRKIK